MGRHFHHHHKHQHHHYHDDKNGGPCKRNGPVRRVTAGVGKKLGIGRKWVLAGFIIGVIINAPLTIVAFLVCLFWVDHPGKLERGMETAKDKMRETFAATHSVGQQPAYASAAEHQSSGDPERDVDFDFNGLRRKFKDLERRAADVESHVTSEEYTVNQEINRMKDQPDT